ncbi:MAG: hypothetical protein ACI9MR_004479 [Myxococcota bacterium]|jgi:hypothetical protein
MQAATQKFWGESVIETNQGGKPGALAAEEVSL